MKVDKLRKKIDWTDLEIVKLLNERMELAIRTEKVKEKIEDSEREKIVINRVKSHSVGLINPEFSEKMFREVIKESKKLQKKNLKLIGFQGEHGAYSEIAAKIFEKDAAYLPFNDFADVFEQVESGNLDYGIVPVQNSLGGVIAEVNDLLITKNLKVVAEINLQVHHCLLTLPETDYRDIKVAYSHPQALSQCRQFLRRNKIEAKEFYDTAGAAEMLFKEKPRATAAIASKLAAEMYNLEIIKENIEDYKSNTTRFIIIAKKLNTEDGDKCSTIFSTKHKEGALFNVLKIFAENKINLTRIESRPIRENQGEYAFFLDFKGSDKDEKVKRVLEEVKKETTMFKFLGCYKEAEQVNFE